MGSMWVPLFDFTGHAPSVSEPQGTDFSVPRRRLCAAWTERSVPGLWV
jgi:hypothetical protein